MERDALGVMEEIRDRMSHLNFRARQQNAQAPSERNQMLHLLATLGIGQLTLNEEGRYLSGGIGIRRLLNASSHDVPVAELFGTDSARRYFSAMHDLLHELPAARDRAERTPWTRVWPDPADTTPLAHWHAQPKDTWEFEGALARSLLNDTVEWYLCSPRQLIGTTDDFRIGYTACANGAPADLSIVVGARLDIQRPPRERRWRPETNGYCFAFGVYNNSGTTLQRSYRDIVPLADMRIEPGRNHRCLAERIGGQLRFEVDGREVFRTLDLLPLMYEDHGYVCLYCCAAGSVFRDVTVDIRPTALDAETLARIDSLRAVTIETAAGSRQVNIHYAGGRTFIVQDTDMRLRNAPSAE